MLEYWPASYYFITTKKCIIILDFLCPWLWCLIVEATSNLIKVSRVYFHDLMNGQRDYYQKKRGVLSLLINNYWTGKLSSGTSTQLGGGGGTVMSKNN